MKKNRHIIVVCSITFLLFLIISIVPDLQSQDIELRGSESVKLSLVRYSPVFPGCKDLSDELEIRNCLSESITKHFKDNFNFNLFETLNSERELIDPEVFSKIPLRIDGTIIKDLGKMWLVRLDATIAGKKYDIEIEK
ncbi:MAG: hypothetical protein RIC06_02155 [Cyclobacteriaceae bacterium]